MDLDRIRRLRQRLPWNSDTSGGPEPLGHLRAATAQLLVATAAGATLDHAAPGSAGRLFSQDKRRLPAGLVWAPALLGPLAAAAHLEHNRRPSNRTAAAVRLLDAAAMTTGGALFILDALTSEEYAPRRIGSLAFASAGLLGLTLAREETSLRSQEAELRRQANLVERLIPRRRARLDRVVVHV